MIENEQYARYMLAWLRLLEIPPIDEIKNALTQITDYWDGSKDIDLASIKEKLWDWVDTHGGSRVTSEKHMLVVRMLLCLTYEDNRELEDMGFFDDLLNHYGVPRRKINQYSPANLPKRI